MTLRLAVPMAGAFAAMLSPALAQMPHELFTVYQQAARTCGQVYTLAELCARQELFGEVAELRDRFLEDAGGNGANSDQLYILEMDFQDAALNASAADCPAASVDRQDFVASARSSIDACVGR